MLKRKACSDLYEDDIKRLRLTPQVHNHEQIKTSFSIINEDLDVVMNISYQCDLHDDDKFICEIYDCSGCGVSRIFSSSDESYIN
jgi:hypothetical protein